MATFKVGQRVKRIRTGPSKGLVPIPLGSEGVVTCSDAGGWNGRHMTGVQWDGINCDSTVFYTDTLAPLTPCPPTEESSMPNDNAAFDSLVSLSTSLKAKLEEAEIFHRMEFAKGAQFIFENEHGEDRQVYVVNDYPDRPELDSWSWVAEKGTRAKDGVLDVERKTFGTFAEALKWAMQ